MSGWDKDPQRAWSTGLQALSRRVDRLAASAQSNNDAHADFVKIANAGDRLYEMAHRYIQDGADDARAGEWSRVRQAALAAVETSRLAHRDAMDRRLSDMKMEHRRAQHGEPPANVRTQLYPEAAAKRAKKLVLGRLV